MTCVCCAHCGDFYEWSDCDFSSADSNCKHSCLLLFSARIYLTLLWEGDGSEKLARDSIVSKRSITFAILGLFQKTMAYKPAFHAYSAALGSFLYSQAFSWECYSYGNPMGNVRLDGMGWDKHKLLWDGNGTDRCPMDNPVYALAPSWIVSW